ncbi:TOMM precursor leader peptide-binding protein [Streptomyces sp. NPDC006544]|uniref:TOMM precursor leader peptide-binding protein n=1 Tax=Streptomyces sp. NPDC006544 TaxID=3154583 RepID=UPI0033B0E296
MLRQDSVFLEAEDGVFLRSGAGDFFIKGPWAYALLSRLARVLAGGATLRELCRDLPAERARVVSTLVRSLADRDVVRTLDDEPDGLLGAAEQERFAEQLAYLAHHTRAPRAALRRVRDARVAVLGGTASAWSAVRTLARNGVGHLAFLDGAPAPAPAPAPGADADEGSRTPSPTREFTRVERLAATWTDGWQDTLTAWRPTAVIAAPDGVPGALLGPLAGVARRTGAAFLTARAHGDLVIKGPLAAAPGPRSATACPQCLRLQLADHAEESLAAHVLRDGETTADHLRYRSAGARTALSPLLAEAVASELAMDLFKHLAGVVEPDLAGAIVVQRTDTLETWRETLPRRSDCPACGRPEESRLKEFREGGLDLPGSPGERLTRYRSVLAPATGILRAFDDDTLPQTPVHAGRIRTGALVGPRRYGFGVATPQEARVRAVEHALRQAAYRAPAPLRVRHATRAQLRAAGAEPAAAAPGPPAVATAWTEALRLRDDALVWVPLERALTEGGGSGAGAGTGVGVGVGATVREVVETALASTLLDERLREWLDGRCVPGPVEASDIDTSHTPLARALLGTGALTLASLPPMTAHGLQVVLARHEAPDHARPLQVAAAGPTGRAATATALRELSGLTAHPDAADQGPGGSHHVVCPPDWPAPPGRPTALGELPDPEVPQARTGPADLDTQPGPGGLQDLLGLVPPDRDVLLVRLAPAGLPRTPAGEPVVLMGRVLLVDAPHPRDRVRADPKGTARDGEGEGP